MTRIGVLALQGDFEAHTKILRGLGVSVVEVRRIAELSGLDGLVIPGGESTTLLNLMADEPWFDSLKAFHERGGALMGTCAGAILLSREVEGPRQESIGLLDARIERNAFGRQVDSFETTLEAPALGGPIEAVFIRAPRFLAVGPNVVTLAAIDGEPVMVREGRVLALTFHPELTRDARLHAYFAGMAKDAAMSLAGTHVPAGRVP
jgi:pyridoxal 5'-phosphate synthase pdxT subunit